MSKNYIKLHKSKMSGNFMTKILLDHILKRPICNKKISNSDFFSLNFFNINGCDRLS